MKNKQSIEERVEEALNSVEGISRATANPYLFTRIKATLENSRETTWEKIAGIIGRPSVVLSGLSLVIIINVLVILVHTSSKQHSISEQLVTSQPDAYNTTVATIYDIENIEP